MCYATNDDETFMHSFPVFIRGEKDFSILDALHFFHTLEVFLELFGAEAVLVSEPKFVDVCFFIDMSCHHHHTLVSQLLVMTVTLHPDSVRLHTAHFQLPLNSSYLSEASCSH